MKYDSTFPAQRFGRALRPWTIAAKIYQTGLEPRARFVPTHFALTSRGIEPGGYFSYE